MKKLAFTHTNYLKIIDVLKRSGRQIGGVADFFQGKGQKNAVILRHDVDRRPKQAIRLAQLENRLNIRATYYFRASSSGHFPARTIQTIAELGHEVGYHYETYSVCRGDRSRALELFARSLESFRQLNPCLTVSAHGAPLSPYDNLELLKDIDLQKYGLIADAVLSFTEGEVIYYTDAGGSWNATKIVNKRDRIPSLAVSPAENVPFELEALAELLKNSPKTIYLNTHSERWAHNTFNWLICRTSDLAASLIKRHLLRRQR